MKSSAYDVVVIGAGPAGSVAARKLARKKHRVLLIEKRAQIGIPVRCGEATTSLSYLEEHYGPIPAEAIETILHGLVFHGTGGVSLEAHRPDCGVMLNREKFDPWLAHLAEKDGAEVVVRACATAVSAVQNGLRTVTVSTPEGSRDITAKMVVGADGVESKAGQMVGLSTIQKPNQTCTGVDIQVKGLLTKPDSLTFWQGCDFVNDGYIWSFPKQKSNVTNFGVGFLVSKYEGVSPKQLAMNWLKKLFPNAEVTGVVVGGAIPVSGNLPAYTKERFLLAGDAAHHSNPMTGGGIASAMKAAELAAEVIHEGLLSGDLSEQFLKIYETRCMEAFGNSHAAQLDFRKFILAQNRKDQAALYRLIKAYVDGGEKKWKLLLSPLKSLKFGLRFFNFKAMLKNK
ncbi:MAG: NAD(P)/FAD-dependent oxidoreductase [Fibrobacter sp.]|jgi:digeranylgeranylglycerophospholipid reductase|nr:NAD(P)/FAD-dependent oxidoreductase [Fibrobacter sp.]